jgi:uncharacterized protein YfaS (alpha-2-macroglobulin family)
MNEEKMKRAAFVLLFFLPLISLFAGVHVTNQKHSGQVTAIASAQKVFFTADSEGFIVRWNENAAGERYQISEVPIKLIAVHPNGEDIAVYETNGSNIHRVSVWNWRTLNRKYVKRFSDSITALSYTKKGS